MFERLSSATVVACALSVISVSCGASSAHPALPRSTPKEPSARPETQATPPLASAMHVRTLEGIAEYALPNGLRFLLVPDDTQAMVTVNVTDFVTTR